MGSIIKVLIADKHDIVRQMLRRVLSESDEIQIVAESTSSDEMFKQLYRHDCDLLLLDISIAIKNLSDAIKEIKLARPEISILVLSAYHEDQYEKHVLRSGACGYLAKSEAPEKLLETIQNLTG